MNAKLMTAVGLLTLLLCACAGIGAGRGTALTLQNAIEQSADKIAADLKAKSAVAVVAFESENDNLSAHIMEELNGALFERGMVVVEREYLEYVQKELNFQMSGDVSDESAQSIGKFFGAELVVTGRLTNLGDNYRYQINAVHVQTAERESVVRLDVANNGSMRRMVAALAAQKSSVRVASYAVTDQTRPQTATEYLNKGIMFSMRGDYNTAIAEFDEALKINPDLVGAYMLRAGALSASVSKVIAVGENFSGITIANTGRQVTAEQARVLDRAIADYTQVIRLNPNSADAYTNRGSMYGLKGDPDRAIADYNQAIRLNPNFVNAYYLRGAAYWNKGDNDRAIADYTQAIRLNPNYAYAYIGRGVAYDTKGDQDRAIADYTQAIRLNPDLVEAYNNRGVAYNRKGDNDRAIADFTQAIRLNSDLAEAYSNRGNAYSAKGDNDRAIADFTQAIRLDPNYIEAYTGRGHAYYRKGDYDRTIADYTQAIRLNPNYIEAYLIRAGMYVLKIDADRAIADYEAALRINPNDANAKQGLERAQWLKRNVR